ncbi:MAG: hypothetical protein ACI4Q3_01525 [Kiritimatiellia bacterium]
MKNAFFKTAALLCAAVFAFSAPAAYTPAGTVTFANLDTIADAVAGIAGKGPDPLLKSVLPKTIRGQVAARLFGAMRPGMPGVAVCYVDAAAVARLTASSQHNRRSDEAFDRTKFWAILYPASIKRAAFLQRHPEAKADRAGIIRIPPGPHSRRTFYAWYSPDGNWVTLAPSAAMATHTYKQGVAALARPLGRDLAYVRLDSRGVRAIFQSDICAGAEFSVRMTPAGLELRGTARKVMIDRAYLPPGALAFSQVPANAPLFGATTDPKDIRSFDIFSLFGPDAAKLVQKSLLYRRGAGSSTFSLEGVKGMGSALRPRDRLLRILPEAKTMPAANVMFCSLTTTLQVCLPKVASTLMPFESMRMHAAKRLLRAVRGDGMGFIGWREGDDDKYFIRISRDDLRGTSNLWSLLFL